MIPVIYRNQAHPYYRWRYEGLITLTNPPTVDNFQVTVAVPYQLGMKRDFSDLRFADIYGNAISYWIESKTDGSTATAWVKIPGKDSSIFFYWGNELAVSESNGSNVFDLFDDFSAASIDYTTKWRNTGGTTNSVSGGIATIQCTSATGVIQRFISQAGFGSGYAVAWRYKPACDTWNWAGWTERADNYGNVALDVGVTRYSGAAKSRISYHNSSFSSQEAGAVDNDNYITREIKRISSTSWAATRDGSDSVSLTASANSNTHYVYVAPYLVGYIYVDWVYVRKCAATEPTPAIAYIGVNKNYRRATLADPGGSVEADTISFTSSIELTTGTPELFLSTDALSLQSNIQMVSSVGSNDKIPITSFLTLTPAFSRMRSFGDISALASESVDISKGINDTMWVLRTAIRGDSPAEFFHYGYETADHSGTAQILFSGFTPDTVNSHTAIKTQSDVVMYDYGWYLSAQYLPDSALVINLGGSRSTWAEWIRYLLEGTGITPYRIASSTADDKEFNFTARTTKRDAIDTISQYCGFIFVVGWNTSTPPEPIAYWIDQEDIDDPSTGLDLPAAVTITWPDSHLVEIPSVQGTPEEKINRVRIRGNDTSGNWYSATLQTAALTAGEEIAREYYEESSVWNSQAKVNARALALYNYFTTITYTVEAKLLKRMDLRLYQKIRFQGSGFSSKLTALGWLRIIEIHYHISGIEKYVTIKAVTDKGQMSLLLERMNYAAGGTISDISTIVSDQISAIPMTEVGTVLSISGDIATVQTESGKIVQARVIL
jgi:hypothetical protein